jgi:hypothetical protein
MSLSIQYENVHDAQMRLQNTVILYDGEPVWISEVGQVGAGDPKGDIFRVYIRPLPINGKEAERKFISSKKFDLAPFPMGFMNKNGNVYYCSRLPRRQQRQGLSNQTFACSLIDGSSVERPRREFNLENLVSDQCFLDCIKGKYPNVAEATRQIEEGNIQGVAFHRCFAIIRDAELSELIYLYHKREKVGFIMNGQLKLSKKGNCLKEALNEVGVRC